MKRTVRAEESRAITVADGPFLTPEELKDLLQIPIKTLAAWRSERKGPLFVRMGIHVRYAERHVNDWLAELTEDAQEWMES
ncbi:helix-turn-helix domain-containing protein [Nocardioides sp. KIGAM211]|uniref:Helix-turn-helix domain-containing protein n=1 Tax=Nocardioides luti TaxID=2761101 RepID=A0A7X0VA92_9ACTN|nr:helix-turn-helix domain-containing protein [Nocardioides luti]MBB6627509.1 helix-turn-helix domain-containing protein [Nocardioides luti]